MPTLITRGAMSVQALGSITTSGGAAPDYWIGSLDVASGPFVYSYDYFNLAFDSDNEIYLNFDSLSSGTFYFSLIKFGENTGAIEWQKYSGQRTTSNNIYFGNAMAIDPLDNIYTLYRDESSQESGLTKYNTSGTIQWKKGSNRIVGGQEILFNSVLIDSSNNIILTAGRNSKLTLIKLDPTGSVLSTNDFLYPAYGLFSSTTILRHAAGNSNNEFVQSARLTASENTFSGAVVNKFDNNLNLLWSRFVNHTGTESFDARGGAVAVDSNGDVYFAMSFTAAGLHYLVKISSDGNSILWAKSFPSFIASVCIDSSDGAYALDINGYIYSFDSSGTVLWCNRLIDSINYSAPLTIAANDSGFLSIAILATDESNENMAVAKIPSDGSLTGGTYNFGGYTFYYTSETSAASPASCTLTSISTTSPGLTYTNSDGSIASGTTSYIFDKVTI